MTNENTSDQSKFIQISTSFGVDDSHPELHALDTSGQVWHYDRFDEMWVPIPSKRKELKETVT